MSSKNTITVLDCTLRDGGYYTNWCFDDGLVAKYFDSMDSAGVDIVEVGLRFPVKDQFMGPFGYCTDSFLADLNLPRDAKIAVMINAKDPITHPKGPRAACLEMFKPAAESSIDIIRVAFHFPELEQGPEIVNTLIELGYEVGVNLMQVGNRTADELRVAAQDIAAWEGICVFYFADSFGNMGPAEVTQAIDIIAEYWEGPIGFHSHDNMGRALDNVLAAIDAGATWVDGTVLGMGRGPGNVRTEYVLMELKERNIGRYNPESLYPLVLDDFGTLHRQHQWGPSLLYRLSAMYGIHPSYVQEMTASSRYQHDQILSALEFLRGTKATSFKEADLRRAIAGSVSGAAGTWNADGWLKGRTVLIIGSGPSLSTHLKGIENFIKEQNPAVLCLNVNKHIDRSLVTAYVACHPSRVMVEAAEYRSLGRPLILPKGAFPDIAAARLKEIEILDYGIQTADGTFAANAGDCVVPSALALGYALAVANAAGAQNILMAGFDGYPPGDGRLDDMLDLLDAYGGAPSMLPLTAVTPTSYPIHQRSIYAPAEMLS